MLEWKSEMHACPSVVSNRRRGLMSHQVTCLAALRSQMRSQMCAPLNGHVLQHSLVRISLPASCLLARNLTGVGVNQGVQPFYHGGVCPLPNLQRSGLLA